MKKIGEKVVYVTFNSGDGEYVCVDLYKGKTLEECIRSIREDIDGYVDNEEYIKL